MSSNYIFTSESVTEGHPDKICDQISDAIVDEIYKEEAHLQELGYVNPKTGEKACVDDVRCAIETFATTGIITVMGEVRTQGYVDIEAIVRDVVDSIGYSSSDFGFDSNTCAVGNFIHKQSPDIALGVDKSYEAKKAGSASSELDLAGAGDQGMMFGYACDETDVFMPMPIYLAHRLSQRLTQVRKDGTLRELRPDGKTQVSVRYIDDEPVAVEKILISTQHAENTVHDDLEARLIANVISPVMNEVGIDWNRADIYVNPTGRFVIGGPMGDTGLTGRKIIVDTYGGMGRHGGGSFSGKDCSKVDRSAAYAARWVAKNIVAAQLARKCEVQVAYAIGMAAPISVMVETFGTECIGTDMIEKAVQEVFDLRPAAIIKDLDLRRPIYRLTTNYGHFGRELPEFTWEKADRADALRQACGL